MGFSPLVLVGTLVSIVVAGGVAVHASGLYDPEPSPSPSPSPTPEPTRQTTRQTTTPTTSQTTRQTTRQTRQTTTPTTSSTTTPTPTTSPTTQPTSSNTGGGSTADQPDCTDVTFDDSSNIQIDGSSDAGTLTVSCPAGYNPQGENVFTCQNGQWTTNQGAIGNPADIFSCQDIDECADDVLNNCDPHASCVNNDGGFSCEIGPQDVPNPCDPNPCNPPNGDCAPNEADGSFTCTCNPGYTGDNCQTQDVPDPCSNVDCGQHGNCDASSGTCICSDGYTGSRCENAPLVVQEDSPSAPSVPSNQPHIIVNSTDSDCSAYNGNYFPTDPPVPLQGETPYPSDYVFLKHETNFYYIYFVPNQRGQSPAGQWVLDGTDPIPTEQGGCDISNSPRDCRPRNTAITYEDLINEQYGQSPHPSPSTIPIYLSYTPSNRTINGKKFPPGDTSATWKKVCARDSNIPYRELERAGENTFSIHEGFQNYDNSLEPFQNLNENYNNICLFIIAVVILLFFLFKKK